MDVRIAALEALVDYTRGKLLLLRLGATAAAGSLLRFQSGGCCFSTRLRLLCCTQSVGLWCVVRHLCLFFHVFMSLCVLLQWKGAQQSCSGCSLWFTMIQFTMSGTLLLSFTSSSLTPHFTCVFLSSLQMLGYVKKAHSVTVTAFRRPLRNMDCTYGEL